MALLWPKDPADVVDNQPRLHALVIGVARYPHLNGGGGALAADPLGLGQVTTPEFTARAVTKWLCDEYQNPDRPLGSVELLLSAPSPQPGEEPATMDNCEAAVNRWEARCSSDPGNVAFFYFCGHGLAKDEQYLLPEDFGSPAFGDPWRNCIDFDGLRLGLRFKSQAETHLFFIDACRETPFGTLTQAVSGRSLLGGQGFATAVKSQAVYFATTEGKQAYGPSDGQTYFSEAVLQSLQGLASANPQGYWVVNTYSLSNALGQLMDHFADRYGQPLTASCDVNGRPADLHRPKRPLVLTAIQCTTAAANAVADIELRGKGESHRSGFSDPKPLTCAVEPGQWDVLVTFQQGQFPNSPVIPCLLTPPIFEGVAYPPVGGP